MWQMAESVVPTQGNADIGGIERRAGGLRYPPRGI